MQGLPRSEKNAQDSPWRAILGVERVWKLGESECSFSAVALHTVFVKVQTLSLHFIVHPEANRLGKDEEEDEC